MRPEHQLLVCIARKSLDERASGRLRNLIQTEIDWNYLIKSASHHALLPLLASHLSAQAPDLVPQPMLTRLKSECVGNRQDNLYLLRELFRVLRIFTAEHIRTLAFKGPLLGAILYADVGLRQVGDLDLLVAKEDFLQAREALQSAGYLMEPQLTAAQQASHLRSHCEIQFVHQDQFCVVDLHWALTPRSFPFYWKLDDLFSRRQTILLGGQTIETFSTEDLLLYLCVHGAKHYWTRLEWIAAVAELVRSGQALDWSLVSQRAKESKSEKILALGLLLTTSLFAVELPPEISQAPDSSLRQCAQVIQKRLFLEQTTPTSQLEMFRLNLQFMNRRRDAVASLLRSMLVPTISDWQSVNLSGPLYPLYYGFRPMRLLGKYGRRKSNPSANV